MTVTEMLDVLDAALATKPRLLRKHEPIVHFTVPRVLGEVGVLRPEDGTYGFSREQATRMRSVLVDALAEEQALAEEWEAAALETEDAEAEAAAERRHDDG
jgi:hypothetical protein